MLLIYRRYLGGGMKQSIKIVIKQLLRPLHRHEKSAPDVFLFALPRSGSTLLTEMMATGRGVKVASETFSLVNGSPSLLCRHLSPDSLAERYVDLSDEQLSGVVEYLYDISKGRYWNAYNYADLRKGSYRYSSNRTFHKLQKLNYHYREIMDHFASDRAIYLVRHPAAVALSRIRNGWRHYISDFAQAAQIANSLSIDQTGMIRQISDGDSELLRFVLSWCLENYIIYHYPLHPSTMVIRYEDMVSDTEQSLRSICQHVDMKYQPSMMAPLARPSRGIVHSDSTAVEAITQRDQDQILYGWRSELSARQLDQIGEVLRVFKIHDYVDSQ